MYQYAGPNPFTKNREEDHQRCLQQTSAIAAALQRQRQFANDAIYFRALNLNVCNDFGDWCSFWIVLANTAILKASDYEIAAIEQAVDAFENAANRTGMASAFKLFHQIIIYCADQGEPHAFSRDFELLWASFSSFYELPDNLDRLIQIHEALAFVQCSFERPHVTNHHEFPAIRSYLGLLDKSRFDSPSGSAGEGAVS